MECWRHIISVLVENEFGVLAKISGLFSGRGFNIESLAVGHSEVPGLSRMTFVVDASTVDAEQVVKQVDKLIDVVHIEDITNREREVISRELVMVKVRANLGNRTDILNVASMFHATVIDVTPESMIIEAAGDEEVADHARRHAHPVLDALIKLEVVSVELAEFPAEFRDGGFR